MALDPAHAAEAVGRVAEPLGLSLEAAARGILAIADNNMVGAIRVVSVERGHDPRDFTLVPFGGAGPLHGCAIADLLGITRVLVPPAPGVLCAQGLLAADLKAEFTRSVAEPLDSADPERLDAAFAALESDAAAWFEEEEVAPEARRIRRVVLMRYEEQGHELPVAWRAPAELAALGADLAAAHRALYGFDLPGVAMEIVTLRVEATGVLPVAAPARPNGGAAAAAEIARQALLLGGRQVEVPVLDRARLGVGAEAEGPAIISQMDATTLLGAGWRATVHASGAMLLTRSP
jgi:N-methylhydantoinase A